MTPVRKTTQSTSDDLLLFNLTDASVDSYDDSVDPLGVDTVDFRRNPICLLNHSADAPIGTWTNLRIVNNALQAHLRLAPEGASQKSDEARKLIACGILRGVSIGFQPITSQPRPGAKRGGTLYKSVRLIEASVVSIPANPNALLQAKTLGVSNATIKLLGLDNATIAQRIAYAKEVTARARAYLAASAEKEKIEARRATLKRAKDYLAKAKVDDEAERLRKWKAMLAKARKVANPPPEIESHFVTWRGVRIQLNFEKPDPKKNEFKDRTPTNEEYHGVSRPPTDAEYWKWRDAQDDE